ncbi:MAG: EamA family transporter [Candidatus Cloacimonetes bacterium]|nr:EamA family transporter [Candidatus Cloacimonadota bacterium]
MSYIYLLITVFLFSTLEVTGKLIGPNISPFAVTIYRFMLGGIFILPFALYQIKKTKLKLSWQDFGKLSIPGIVNVTISMLFLQLAIFYGEASISAILISANPIFVAIFASMILKEKLSFSKIIGLIIGLIGVILIIGAEANSGSTAKDPFLGILFGCISSITFGLYTVLSKKYIKQYGNMVTNSFAFLIGSVILLLVSFIFGFQIEFQPTPNNLIFLGYLGFFVSGLAYLTFFEGLKKVPTATGSMFFFLKPIIASILAFIFFQEQLSHLQLLGIFIVLFGLNYNSIISKLPIGGVFAKTKKI